MNSEKQYIQAFNNGYLLAQHEPKLLNSISQGLTLDNNYLEGLFEGREQFELENSKKQLLDLQKLRNKADNKDKSIGY